MYLLKLISLEILGLPADLDDGLVAVDLLDQTLVITWSRIVVSRHFSSTTPVSSHLPPPCWAPRPTSWDRRPSKNPLSSSRTRRRGTELRLEEWISKWIRLLWWYMYSYLPGSGSFEPPALTWPGMLQLNMNQVFKIWKKNIKSGTTHIIWFHVHLIRSRSAWNKGQGTTDSNRWWILSMPRLTWNKNNFLAGV